MAIPRTSELTAESALGNPYRGLVPFDEHDASFFFGRDKERRLVTANLIASRLTLIFGPSGVGKSSLLRAGVLVRLRMRAEEQAVRGAPPRFLPVIFNSWHDYPLAALCATVSDSVSRLYQGHTKEVELPDFDALPFSEALRVWTRKTGVTLLVVLDQFEEYFLYRDSDVGATSFETQFPLTVASEDIRINFAVSIREDALAKLDRFKGQVPHLFGNYLRIDHLDAESARQAIKGPVAEYNRVIGETGKSIQVEPALVDAVVEGVQRRSDPSDVLGEIAGRGGRMGEGRITAPFLQLVMQRIWDSEMKVRSRTLRLQTFRGLGGAASIVSSHLDQAMASLSESDRAIAAHVFGYLVTSGGMKVAYSLGDLAEISGIPEDVLERVVDRLVQQDVRILEAVTDSPKSNQPPRYQVSHDVLARPIRQWRRDFLEAASRRRLTHRVGGVAAACVILVIAFAFIWQRQATMEVTEQARARISGVRERYYAGLDLASKFRRGIAFTSGAFGQADLYALEATGGRVRQLTRSNADDSSAAWAPDGNMIAFHSSRDGDYDIYVMRADGSGLEVLTDEGPGREPAVDSAPSWSPDGNSIVFYSDRGPGKHFEIYVISLIDRRVKRLTHNAAYDAFPDWSPGGGEIVFYSDRGGGGQRIYVMELKGAGHRDVRHLRVGKVVPLTRPLRGFEDYVPRWSPDGTQVAFERRARDETSAIYVIDADGEHERRLTEGEFRNGAPAWSPNGARVAFHSDRDGDFDVYIAPVKGALSPQTWTLLTQNKVSDQYPAWSWSVKGASQGT